MCALSESRVQTIVTPFGEKLRSLRKRLNVSQKEMAAGLGVSAAYLSALEHGKRGVPPWAFVQRIITYFNIIWDEAEELQALASSSDPKPQLDTTALSAEATRLANMLLKQLPQMSETDIRKIISQMEKFDRNGKKQAAD